MKNLLIALVTLTSMSAFAAYDCELKTPFNGTYIGKAPTEFEAKRTAIKECEAKVGSGSIWCEERSVKCVYTGATLCLLKTPFDGTFEGSASTILEAKRSALKNCEAKVGTGSIWCDERKIVCSDI